MTADRLRFPLGKPCPQPTPWRRAARGLRYGALMGAICLGVGIVRAIVALALGARITAIVSQDLVFALLYLGSFAAGGALAGALWPLRRNWWGALLVGWLAAGIVSAASGVIVLQLEHSRDLAAYALVVGIMTVIYGTFAAYKFQKD